MDEDKKDPVWNPWTIQPSEENSEPPETKTSGETKENVPTPPPWPVEIKPPLPTNVSSIDKPADLSSGETVPEQKPSMVPTDTEYHRQILDLLRKIDEKLDKVVK